MSTHRPNVGPKHQHVHNGTYYFKIWHELLIVTLQYLNSQARNQILFVMIFYVNNLGIE